MVRGGEERREGRGREGGREGGRGERDKETYIYIYTHTYIYVCGTFRVYVSTFGFFRVKQRKQLVLQCFEAASNV